MELSTEKAPVKEQRLLKKTEKLRSILTELSELLKNGGFTEIKAKCDLVNKDASELLQQVASIDDLSVQEEKLIRETIETARSIMMEAHKGSMMTANVDNEEITKVISPVEEQKKVTKEFEYRAKLESVYYEKITELKPSTDMEEQKRNLHEIKKTLNNLKEIDSDTNTEYLKEQILSKFSAPILRESLRSLLKTPEDMFTTDELVTALMTTIHVENLVKKYSVQEVKVAQEVQMEVKASPVKEKKCSAVTMELVGNDTTNKCRFCDGSHLSQDCRQYCSLKVRQKRISSKRLCFFCLKRRGHLSDMCDKKNDPCSFCRKTGHHVHMCEKYLETKENRQMKSKDAESNVMEVS